MEPARRKRMFENAVREHGPLVARVAQGYEHRRDMADELVQEVFLGLWRALPRYRGEAGMRTLVARIAHNVCVSHVRRAARATSEPLDDDMPDPGTTPEEAASRDSRRQRLLAAVRRLALPMRQVMLLHLEGFTNGEIAEALSMTEGNVAVRLTRSRAALKTMLGGST